MSKSRIQLTKHRVNALAEVMARAKAKGALLMLLDGEVGQLLAIPSYGTGCFAGLVTKLENKSLLLQDIDPIDVDLAEVEKELAASASKQGWKSSSGGHLASISIAAPDSELGPGHLRRSLLGFVVLEFEVLSV